MLLSDREQFTRDQFTPGTSEVLCLQESVLNVSETLWGRRPHSDPSSHPGFNSGGGTLRSFNTRSTSTLLWRKAILRSTQLRRGLAPVFWLVLGAGEVLWQLGSLGPVDVSVAGRKEPLRGKSRGAWGTCPHMCAYVTIRGHHTMHTMLLSTIMLPL